MLPDPGVVVLQPGDHRIGALADRVTDATFPNSASRNIRASPATISTAPINIGNDPRVRAGAAARSPAAQRHDLRADQRRHDQRTVAARAYQTAPPTSTTPAIRSALALQRASLLPTNTSAVSGPLTQVRVRSERSARSPGEAGTSVGARPRPSSSGPERAPKARPHREHGRRQPVGAEPAAAASPRSAGSPTRRRAPARAAHRCAERQGRRPSWRRVAGSTAVRASRSAGARPRCTCGRRRRRGR